MVELGVEVEVEYASAELAGMNWSAAVQRQEEVPLEGEREVGEE